MDKSTNRIKVAVGVVISEGKILLAQRSPTQHQPLSWEFPGGKIEPAETVIDALRRELLEEVGIVVKDHAPFVTIPYDYPDKKVELFVHKVLSFEGTPKGLENQPIRWVKPQDLKQYAVPEANQAIVDLLITLNLS